MNTHFLSSARAVALLAGLAVCAVDACAQLAAPARAAASDPAGNHAAPPQAALGCLIDASAMVEVGAAAIGVLDAVLVERGDVVRKGQVLAQLESNVERAAVMLAQTKVRNQADIAAARSQKEYLLKRAERTAMLTDLKFVSSQAREQADTEASLADSKLALAQEQQVLAVQELQLARAQLGQRVIVSPLAGVVVDRYSSAGERIENRPVLKIAQIDPLRVEVVLPASQFSRIKPGMSARVLPELQGTSAQAATVAIVDRVIDAASNTFRARRTLPNRDLSLPSGVRCKVEFAS